MDMHFDLIVIGSGPAGQKAALQGAKAGKKVAIIEKYSAFGGGCVHFGTLPSKSFRESVYRYSLGSRGALGQEIDARGATKHADLPEMERLLRRRDRVVSVESQIIFNQLTRNRIQMFHGTASFLSPNEIEIVSPKKRETIQGDIVIIAVGAGPVAPKNIPVNGKGVFDSNNILTLKRTPKSMIVLGAGVIGCEYASMFATAGTQVTLVDRRHEILASVDREIVGALLERFSHHDMHVLLEYETEKVEVLEKGSERTVRVTFNSEKHGRKVVEAETMMVALGRFGNTTDLGLAKAGLQADERGLIKVDRSFRTAVPSIYAVGDVVGQPALASTSMEQGRIACCHAFQITGELATTEMPENYPYGIYTIPEISMVGRTEEELKQKKVDFVVGKARYKELARGQIVGDRWGILKLAVDRQTLKVLGVHILGDSAADLIHIGQAVMNLGGDVHYFIRNVVNYPTLAEAYKTAALNAVNHIHGKTSTR
ncbi:MAG: Si-specific NAD(P)(+) transhydrogenase [Bacteriovoracia bacterium]